MFFSQRDLNSQGKQTHGFPFEQFCIKLALSSLHLRTLTNMHTHYICTHIYTIYISKPKIHDLLLHSVLEDTSVSC